ncbi:MAG TPA: DUF5689 domain-containing protein [Chitinophagaceae bacterium]
MKRIISSIFLLSLVFLWGCKKDKYPGGTISPFIAIFDLRNMDKGAEVTLTKENMLGSGKITGIVISDHSGGNMPAGLLVLQDQRRLSVLRGLAIALGDEARNYAPGDSVIIDVEGGILKRVNGILQVTGITGADVTKVSSGNNLQPVPKKASDILNAPKAYESTLIQINKVGFDPSYPPGSTYAGDKTINDGFGNMILHTEAGAEYANKTLPFMANFTGIVFTAPDATPQLWPRGEEDIMVTAATAPKIAPVVITGYLTDPTSTDANYEYIQLMATKNIDFAVTGFSVVTTNNAGANVPTGFPTNGWATGGQRTYKINLTSGTVSKGEYFYVGANKNIWGANSTDISSSKWITKMYATEDGDGFGTKTTNLLANSGNAAGIAVFDKTVVDVESVPVDVIFFGGAGSIFTAGPPAKGYRITNTDYYDVAHPSTQEEQPFFMQGSNTGKLAFPTTANFSQLGGVYNRTTGRWTTARALKSVPLTATSTVVEIEGATTIEE